MHSKDKPSSALIYDDHTLFAQSFAAFLERFHFFRQVRTAMNERELLSLLVSMTFDYHIYLFLDYPLAEKHSLCLFNTARHISKNVKIIMVTSVNKPMAISNLLSYKPDAIISKSSGGEEIAECLGAVNRGYQYLCPAMTRLITDAERFTKARTGFSQREMELLGLFNNGLSIARAAEEAHLSRYTIINHRSNMMKKTGTKSIVELLAFARSEGFL